MPKVKIKDQDRRASLSIGVVVAAAVVLWFSWLLWSSGPRYTIAQRRLDQVRLVYSCDAGHLFEGSGSVESLACQDAACGQRAWPVWTYQCSKHGAFVLQMRYALQDGRPRIIKVRSVAGEWRDVADEITCPLCERALLPDLSLRRGLLPGTWLGSPAGP